MVMQHQKKQRKTKKIDIKETVKVGKKSGDQKRPKNNIRTLYKSREKVIKSFNYYFKIVSEAKYKTFKKIWRRLKVLICE